VRFNRLPELVSLYTGEVGDLRDWPQLYRASPEFAQDAGHAGLSRAVSEALSGLTQKWKHVSIDTRVSMLVPGMYPCIPGWHVDDFWRPDGKHTDLLTVPEAEHMVMNLGTNSNTMFVNELLTIEIPTVAELGEKSVHAIIHAAVESIDVETIAAQQGFIYRMYPTTIHRGEAARERGWRVFFRLTGSNHREPRDEVRTQTQVYITDPARGW
jgi:hypothetical protein